MSRESPSTSGHPRAEEGGASRSCPDSDRTEGSRPSRALPRRKRTWGRLPRGNGSSGVLGERNGESPRLATPRHRRAASALPARLAPPKMAAAPPRAGGVPEPGPGGCMTAAVRGERGGAGRRRRLQPERSRDTCERWWIAWQTARQTLEE